MQKVKSQPGVYKERKLHNTYATKSAKATRKVNDD